jgi:hypothetical protein
MSRRLSVHFSACPFAQGPKSGFVWPACECGVTREIRAIEAEATAEAVEAERDRLRRLIAVGHPYVRSAATYPGVDAVMREDVLALLRNPNESGTPDSLVKEKS